MICCVCGKEVKKPYSAVWEKRNDQLFISFAHIECSETSEFEDITEEITGKAIGT
jgi:hypothetical protein